MARLLFGIFLVKSHRATLKKTMAIHPRNMSGCIFDILVGLLHALSLLIFSLRLQHKVEIDELM